MTIIAVTATLEKLLAECVGDAPELVKLQDWRTIALRLSRRLEESGLRIRAAAKTAEDRGQLVGPIRRGEVVLTISDGPNQAIVFATGAPMHVMPDGLADQLWASMLEDALKDLRSANPGDR